MDQLFRILAIVVVVLALTACGGEEGSSFSISKATHDDAALGGDYREGEVLVGFALSDPGLPQARSAALTSIHEGIGARSLERIPLPSVAYPSAVRALAPASLVVELVQLPQDVSVEEGVAYYRQQGQVVFAEPNHIVRRAQVPDDPDFSRQWGLLNTGQVIFGDVGRLQGTPGADIDAPSAWDFHTGVDTIVAVIDSGMDYNHPDLRSNVWLNPDEVAGNGVDDDGNGYVDDVRGWDFAGNDNDPRDDDVEGHGTHVAGIVGAEGNNGIGVSGVNWQVRLMPLKFLDIQGFGDIADAVRAISYAVDKGARVINSSYTYPQDCFVESPSQTERLALQRAGEAGVIFVAAAGNAGCDNDVTPFYPASHALDNILSVAASDADDALTSFSNFGPTSVHLAAPGVSIRSTTRTDLGSYRYISGTSMAAPMVSGAAALVFSYRPDLDFRQVMDLLIDQVDPDPTLQNSTISGGRLNLAAAIEGAKKVPLPDPPEPPDNLSAVVGDDGKVLLRWRDNSLFEGGFRLQRRIVPGPFALLASLGEDTTSYVDSGMVDGVVYEYRVQAYAWDLESDFTAAVEAIVPLTAPSDLSATTTSGSVALTWTDNSVNEEWYEIERSEGGGPFVVIGVEGPDTVSFEDRSVTDGVRYDYRVRCRNGEVGPSSPSITLAVIAGDGLVVISGSSASCFIATAAYGSPLAAEVDTLRRFRDRFLMPNALGRAFVDCYYRFSPPVAALIAENQFLKSVVRWFLAPLVWLAEASEAEAMSRPPEPPKEEQSPVVPGELLVKFSEGLPDKAVRQILEREGTTVIEHFAATGIYHLRLPPGAEAREEAERFGAIEGVEFAEPNLRVRLP